MSILLGCIADDFTGATDLASMVVRQGLRAIQTVGVLPGEPPPADAEAVVVALKTRTVPAASAVDQSLAALRWLSEAGCRRFYFKYCSTFDSTPAGNIGPVAEALMDELGVDFTVACPAFPENGRTIYKGYLFVGDTLLSESSMRDHPLTPMTDANLVRVLARQAKRKVGLVDFSCVSQGPSAVRERIASLTAQGVGLAIADALENADLATLGEACVDMPLATGGSGLAWGLAQAIRRLRACESRRRRRCAAAPARPQRRHCRQLFGGDADAGRGHARASSKPAARPRAHRKRAGRGGGARVGGVARRLGADLDLFHGRSAGREGGSGETRRRGEPAV